LRVDAYGTFRCYLPCWMEGGYSTIEPLYLGC
jgi:hypothetical protein